MKYWFFVIVGGTDVRRQGPFKTPKERNDEARKYVEDEEFNMDQDSVFAMDTNGEDPQLQCFGADYKHTFGGQR